MFAVFNLSQVLKYHFRIRIYSNGGEWADHKKARSHDALSTLQT